MTKRQRNERGRFIASSPIDVRSEAQIPKLEALIHEGPITFVLVYADWCGHCVRYKPMWHTLEKTPGRRANIASVHYNMVEKSPTIQKAKLEGYPSVIKVSPSGEIEEYVVPGSEEKTNALPYMRDVEQMKHELKTAVAKNEILTPKPDSGIPGIQTGMQSSNALEDKEQMLQKGGGAMGAFIQAVRAAAPAALLLLANTAVQSMYRKTYKSPKKSSRRASTRRRRRNQ